MMEPAVSSNSVAGSPTAPPITATHDRPVPRFRGYFTDLRHNFGTKFVILLASNYFFVKGAAQVFIQGAQLPYFKNLGVDGAQYQMFGVIAVTPWAMKGIVGALSDTFPLGGYAKRYYMLLACILGSASLCTLASLPVTIAARHTWIPPVLLFFIHVEISTLDLLCEGKYSETMAQSTLHQKTGADAVVTFVWACITLGAFIASCGVGPLADHFSPQLIFWITLPMALHLVVPLTFGFLPEEQLPKELHNRLQMDKIRTRAGVFTLALATATAAVLLAILSLLSTPEIQFAYCITATAGLIGVAYSSLPLHLSHCNLYMYLQEVLCINLSGALDFWYTGNPVTCVLGGPGFDYTYYQTYTQLVGHGAALVGLWIFQSFMLQWRFRHVYWMTTSLRVVASLFDLVLVKRWNIIHFGISDKAMYLLGNSIILPVCTMLNFMPGVILTSRLCPTSLESTVYAILAGFSNFGAATSKTIGVYAMHTAGIQTNEPHCDFAHLPELIVLCHCCLPLLAIPLTFLLLPDCHLGETLETAHPSHQRHATYAFRDATAESPQHILPSPHNPAYVDAQARRHQTELQSGFKREIAEDSVYSKPQHPAAEVMANGHPRDASLFEEHTQIPVSWRDVIARFTTRFPFLRRHSHKDVCDTSLYSWTSPFPRRPKAYAVLDEQQTSADGSLWAHADVSDRNQTTNISSKSSQEVLSDHFTAPFPEQQWQYISSVPLPPPLDSRGIRCAAPTFGAQHVPFYNGQTKHTMDGSWDESKT